MASRRFMLQMLGNGVPVILAHCCGGFDEWFMDLSVKSWAQSLCFIVHHCVTTLGSCFCRSRLTSNIHNFFEISIIFMTQSLHVEADKSLTTSQSHRRFHLSPSVSTDKRPFGPQNRRIPVASFAYC